MLSLNFVIRRLIINRERNQEISALKDKHRSVPACMWCQSNICKWCTVLKPYINPMTSCIVEIRIFAGVKVSQSVQQVERILHLSAPSSSFHYIQICLAPSPSLIQLFEIPDCQMKSSPRPCLYYGTHCL